MDKGKISPVESGNVQEGIGHGLAPCGVVPAILHGGAGFIQADDLIPLPFADALPLLVLKQRPPLVFSQKEGDSLRGGQRAELRGDHAPQPVSQF